MTKSNVTVDLEKLEKLLNKVGDLVITNSMMSQSVDNLPNSDEKKNLLDKILLLQRHIVELQDYATDIRMVNFESMYSTYEALINQNISSDKKIKLQIIGGKTKVDKSMLEHLDSSIRSLILNAVSYGIEPMSKRLEKEKNEVGIIKIIAQQINGQIQISIEDDGVGIEDVDSLLNDEISEEDVDNNILTIPKIKNVVEKLNGTVDIESSLNRGMSITINVPLTHSILDGLNIKVGDNIFILPTASIVESIQATKNSIKSVGDGSSKLLMLRNEFIPIVKLSKVLNIKSKFENIEEGILIVVKSGTQKAAFFVDEFLQQQQIVVKAIETNFRKVKSVAGVTVRGDGSIGIIIDVKNILENL
uniref:chemotaxis protein CheA n=1 Tax=Aliarcobacter sp. TaxID=2321116 RepID=UPI004047BF45